MKVRNFSFPDMEVCFLPKERPSPEEPHSIPSSALAAPTEILCIATGSKSAGKKPHKPPQTRQHPEHAADRLELWHFKKQLCMELQAAQMGNARNPVICIQQYTTAKQLDSISGPELTDLRVFQQPVCLEQPGNTASPNQMRLPTATTR